MSSLAPETPSPGDEQRHWPERIHALSQEWKQSGSREHAAKVLRELWPLVNAAVARYVRLHCHSYGYVDAEDIRDIASDKSAAFIRSLENGQRDLADLKAPQLCSYLSVLARNGLVDTLRRSERTHGRDAQSQHSVGAPLAPEADGAEISMRNAEFLRAISHCVGALTFRAQTVWFLRAFLDLPSKTIATHPDVQMTSPAVDMMLSRTRKSLRDCMEKKGFNSDDAPPGTFVALWDLLNQRDIRLKEGE